MIFRVRRWTWAACAVLFGARGGGLCMGQGTAPSPLPEGRGIASRYPGDAGIEREKRVLLHEDFESDQWRSNWDNAYHDANIRVVPESGRIARGRALEFSVPRQEAEVSNEVVKRLRSGEDRLFLRYYSKFDTTFDPVGSSHNGGYLAAIRPDLPYATPGIRADGRNKFVASFENWRGEQATPSPGHLNVYIYHPEQRSEYGDHFFPTGKVLPFSAQPGNFGSGFVARPDLIPELGRWYCYEFMVQANTPGRRDGRIACWVDGKLAADFPGLRLREDAALKLNHAALVLHIRSNPGRATRKWYDDAVLATEYIGPIAPARETWTANRPR